MPKLTLKTRPKRPDSAALARPKVKYVTHSGGSGLLVDAFDMRTRIGKAYQSHLQEVHAHLGGADAMTLPLRELADQEARLRLVEGFAWAAVLRDGVVTGGQISTALSAFLKAASDRRQVLQLLGIERRSREMTLSDALADAEREDKEQHDEHA